MLCAPGNNIRAQTALLPARMSMLMRRLHAVLKRFHIDNPKAWMECSLRIVKWYASTTRACQPRHGCASNHHQAQAANPQSCMCAAKPPTGQNLNVSCACALSDRTSTGRSNEHPCDHKHILTEAMSKRHRTFLHGAGLRVEED
jgi:hypothetical protein